MDTFYFRKSSKYSIIPSLLIHLRNAFAHNRVFTDLEHKYIVLEDEYNGKLNLYVKLSSIVRLRDIVEAIKSTKDKSKKTSKIK